MAIGGIVALMLYFKLCIIVGLTSGLGTVVSSIWDSLCEHQPYSIIKRNISILFDFLSRRAVRGPSPYTHPHPHLHCVHTQAFNNMLSTHQLPKYGQLEVYRSLTSISLSPHRLRAAHHLRQLLKQNEPQLSPDQCRHLHKLSVPAGPTGSDGL